MQFCLLGALPNRYQGLVKGQTLLYESDGSEWCRESYSAVSLQRIIWKQANIRRSNRTANARGIFKAKTLDNPLLTGAAFTALFLFGTHLLTL